MRERERERERERDVFIAFAFNVMTRFNFYSCAFRMSMCAETADIKQGAKSRG